MKTQASNKFVIFDWGGVIESHKDGEYNIDCALVNLFKRLNNNLEEEKIIKLYNECSVDENGIYISEYYDINDVKKWFEKLQTKFNFNCTFKDFCKIYEEETNNVYYYKEVVKFAYS